MDYFDCHADTLTEIPAEESLWENHKNLDLKRALAFTDRYTQIFALWKDRKLISKEQLEACFIQTYERAKQLLIAQQEAIVWCQNAKQMQEAHDQGKAAAFLSLEDVSFSGSYVHTLSELGIRFVMLTWNYENEYAAGALADQRKGLTKQGYQLVQELLEQGIVLDISHLSDQGVEDILGLTDRPLMASHSNVRDVCAHDRNLKREHIRELIRRKGLIGINFYRPFAGEKIEHIRYHIDAILELGGEDVLAIGGDLDGCGDDFPEGITGIESIPTLYRYLKNAGYGKELLEKLFYKNAQRFLVENL